MNWILLHGALGSKELFEPTFNNPNIHVINFSGHGGAEPNPQGFSIDIFANEIIEFMDAKSIEKASFFGHSMGGYVALKLALNHPQRIEQLITLGTKLAWTKSGAEQEVKQLDAEKIERKVPKFAELLKARHGEEWKNLLSKTAELMLGLGNGAALDESDFKSVRCPIELWLGENDNMVSPEETKQVANWIPNASCRLIPNWHHPLERVPMDELNALLSSKFSF